MLSKPTWLRGYTDCCAAFLSCIVAIVTARCIFGVYVVKVNITAIRRGVQMQWNS